MIRGKHLVVYIAAAMLVACATNQGGGEGDQPYATDLVACKVAIAGAGPAGLFAAYLLSEHTSGVCVFESSSRVGGRYWDVYGGAGVIGVGARRFHDEHLLLLRLADHLDIQFVAGEPFVDRFLVEGHFASTKDEVARRAFPDLYSDYCLGQGRDACEGSLVEAAIWSKAEGLAPKNQESIEQFYERTLGKSELEYVAAILGFRADFKSRIDARSYLSWLENEDALSPTLHYPIGGMSRFSDALARRIVERGVRLFLNEPVTWLRWSSDRLGMIDLEARTIRTQPDFVILAVNARAVRQIKGDVLREIVADPHYQSLLPIPAVVVTQWWDSAWWELSRGNRDATRVISPDRCLGQLEIPTDVFGKNTIATRSVYNDDPACIQFWRAAFKEGRVEAEVRSRLEHLYPDVVVPNPVKTHWMIWPDAWYWQRVGTQFTNEEIAEWAERPVEEMPLALAGDAYNPDYAAWSEGAYRSALRAVLRNFAVGCPADWCAFAAPVPRK